MALPTKAAWTTLKSNAGIAKTAWWKPADAAVGPALDKVESAKAKWKGNKILANAKSYFMALVDLDKAFQKFLNKKDLSNAGPLGNQIASWMTEVHNKQISLAGKMPALEKAAPGELNKVFDEFIL